ncbi:T/G mismatch-specific endonuclease [Geodermatophilus africanus]|uniref:T/G mismatch-specific endonuclease n=1 Tax=Geodermatophilus africanus TaxID=1137993 RepID=A0A1H3G1M2_9ACTN|nr:T/G mismatch-specific endonuclease [Geodermatophilus africanus]
MHNGAAVDDGRGPCRPVRHGAPVPVPPSVPDVLRSRVFRASVVISRGLLTRNQLRGPTWRRVWPGLYAHRDVEVTHALRARTAASLLVPGSVVTGCSAAVLWGVDLVAAEADVELTVPPGHHPVRVPGLRVRRSRLPDGWVCRRRGVAVTTPEATAVRVAAALADDDAVVAVDRLVASGVAGIGPVRSLAAAARGPGSARARDACRLADGLAESPQETRVRLLVHRGGLPAPVAQYVVRDARGFVARVDLAWPEHRVAVEYDGLWHAEPGQFARDRQRLNRLQAAGWRVVFVMAADLRRPDELVARIAAALTPVR